jgi:hypothetical protein
MNVQYAIKDGDIYVLEVNPRASRTVPFVAKTIGLPIAKIAARIMAGESLESFDLKVPEKRDHIAVKEAVFPFARFPGVDTLLGPEMRSTGEVMGLDYNFAVAFAKSQLGAGSTLPTAGTVFVSMRDSDKPASCRCVASAASASRSWRPAARSASSQENGITCAKINKVAGRPPAHRRRHQERRCEAGLQHDRRRPGTRRQPLDASRRPSPQGAVLHDPFGRHRRVAWHRSLCDRNPGSAPAAGLFRVGLTAHGPVSAP